MKVRACKNRNFFYRPGRDSCEKICTCENFPLCGNKMTSSYSPKPHCNIQALLPPLSLLLHTSPFFLPPPHPKFSPLSPFFPFLPTAFFPWPTYGTTYCDREFQKSALTAMSPCVPNCHWWNPGVCGWKQLWGVLPVLSSWLWQECAPLLSQATEF